MFLLLMQDERKLVESLICLRETAGVEADIFTTAQTIINVALVHVKNITVTPTPAAATMQVWCLPVQLQTNIDPFYSEFVTY